MIEIKTKIELKEYIKLIYLLSYRQKGMIIFHAVCILLCPLILLHFMGLLTLPSIEILIGFSIVPLLFFPIIIYFSAKKTFKTHSRIQEEIIYQIDPDKICMIGESFKAEVNWDKLYKIVERKNWFLFYENQTSAHSIPKRCIGNQKQELRAMIGQHPIKSQLRKD